MVSLYTRHSHSNAGVGKHCEQLESYTCTPVYLVSIMLSNRQGQTTTRLGEQIDKHQYVCTCVYVCVYMYMCVCVCVCVCVFMCVCGWYACGAFVYPAQHRYRCRHVRGVTSHSKSLKCLQTKFILYCQLHVTTHRCKHLIKLMIFMQCCSHMYLAILCTSMTMGIHCSRWSSVKNSMTCLLFRRQSG